MPSRIITILGSTGSIGTNTLDVVRQNPDRFRVFALAAGRNVELLARQIREFNPEVVVVQDAEDVDRLRALLSGSSVPELLSGPEALIGIAAASEIDTVMSSIVGVAGLEATYEAITAYLDEKGVDAQDVFMEEYLNDVKATDDPNLEVDIYVLVK